jgi:DMSO/TMAO reductase YedYZ heme-binding membrane subunit
MPEIDKIIVLILGIGVIFFINISHRYLKRIPYIRILYTSSAALLAAFAFTILEGFYLETFFNLLEHLCYLLSTTILFIWCYLVLVKSERE